MYLTIFILYLNFLFFLFPIPYQTQQQYHEKLEEDSPACADEHSICGYVQINSVGFNRVSLCSCQAKKAAGKGSAGHCPLWWERSTVRTVRHGNDFYKVSLLAESENVSSAHAC